MRTYSYESILRAVGRVLDEADARSFAIRDGEKGLLVETFDSNGAPSVQLDFDLADLVELVDGNTRTKGEPAYRRGYAHDDDSLRHFLTRHELVGASR